MQPSVAPAPEAELRCLDDPAAWAGEWRLTLLLWNQLANDVEEAEETAIARTYELTIDVVEPTRLRVTMRGPDPWTGATVEGTADWQRECERIEVSHMRLSNATGAHAELAFELRLDGDRLWGIYGLYDQDATDLKTAYFFDGYPMAAAAARDHAPPINEALEGIPCELACELRHIGVSVEDGELRWNDGNNGYFMCVDECNGVVYEGDGR